MNKQRPTVSKPHGGLTYTGLIYVLAALCCLIAQAASATQYDVEVIVFRNLGAHDDGEQWSTGTTHSDGFARDPFSPGLVNLPESQFTLNDVAGTLQRSSAYQVLAHRIWRQEAYNRRETVPYLLQADGTGDSTSLDGSITLIRERYLHLAVDLMLDTPGARYRLDETRRIRSGELHYFDSPQLGVIARVTPYDSGGEPAPEDSTGAGDTSTVPDEDADTVTEPAPEPD